MQWLVRCSCTSIVAISCMRICNSVRICMRGVMRCMIVRVWPVCVCVSVYECECVLNRCMSMRVWLMYACVYYATHTGNSYVQHLTIDNILSAANKHRLIEKSTFCAHPISVNVPQSAWIANSQNTGVAAVPIWTANTMNAFVPLNFAPPVLNLRASNST